MKTMYNLMLTTKAAVVLVGCVLWNIGCVLLEAWAESSKSGEMRHFNK